MESDNSDNNLTQNQTQSLSKSKSQMKKIAKAEAKAEAKAKAKAQAESTKLNAKSKNSEKIDLLDTTNMTEEDYKKVRESDMQKLEKAGISPYCYKFIVDPKYNLLDYELFTKKYSNLENETECNDLEDMYYVVGRVSRIRRAGGRLLFVDIRIGVNTMQIKINMSAYNKEEVETGVFDLLRSVIRIGDIWGFAGHAARTKAGELSLYVHTMKLVTPCMKLLPPSTKTIVDRSTGKTVEKSGLTNTEVRYRMRDLDLIINPSVQNTFLKRSKIILEIETFLQKELGLIRVETPVLTPSAGGASAEPFKTYSNDYKCELVMRIAPELYLKRLIVGGFQGVYEIGKQFRNEGNDLTHNSEFTSLEYYTQNADYRDLMSQCERLLTHVISQVQPNSSLIVEYDGKSIDFTPPFKSYDMLDALEEFAKIKIPEDLSTEDARDYLDGECRNLGVDCSEPRTTARLLDKLVGKFIESKCVNPTFITGHPKIMSPLSKPDRNGSQRTERFELFVNCTELANAYTELNDPIIQKANFDLQAKAKEDGDVEAMPCDMEFVESLEYGLPATGGFGMGIDRLVMFLTNNTSIREVILFPTMKPGVYDKKIE